MYDYGNARVAAARSRLLGPDELLRLRDARSQGAMLSLLERFEDWRSILAEVASLAAPPGQAIEAAIERFRSVRIGALLNWYEPPARGLVEALVMPLDIERLLAVIRRQRAGEPADRIGEAVAPGALLDAEAIRRLARARSFGETLDRAAAAGLLAGDDARALSRLATSGAPLELIELRIIEATERARLGRARGRGEAARAVRTVVEAERAVRMTSAAETRVAGAVVAAPAERDATLSRLDELSRRGRRDPLGIGTIVGYIAAVEAEAIRLRAVLAGIAAGWSLDLVGEYLQVGPGRRPARGAF